MFSLLVKINDSYSEMPQVFKAQLCLIHFLYSCQMMNYYSGNTTMCLTVLPFCPWWISIHCFLLKYLIYLQSSAMCSYCTCVTCSLHIFTAVQRFQTGFHFISKGLSMKGCFPGLNDTRTYPSFSRVQTLFLPTRRPTSEHNKS